MSADLDPAIDPGSVASPVDGRTARRDRNRDAVLDAVIELFTEGALDPVATEVAARSGVSLRSVYRYFDDLDSLARAAIARQMERFQPLSVIPDIGDGLFVDRVKRITESRIRLFDAIAPTRRAALLRASSNELISNQLDVTRALLCEQVAQMFEQELATVGEPARADVLAALDLVLGFEGYEHLGRAGARSPDETMRAITRAVTALLRP